MITGGKGSFVENFIKFLLKKSKKINKRKEDLLNYVLSNNIIAQQHYIPIYKYSYYKNLKKKEFYGAET